jgi:hypothetical protein
MPQNMPGSKGCSRDEPQSPRKSTPNSGEAASVTRPEPCHGRRRHDHARRPLTASPESRTISETGGKTGVG